MTKAPRSAHDAALDTLRRLRDGGFRALFAGGCVRDQLLGRTPKDYDVATNATPDELLRLFPGARTVGAKFGVVLVRRFGVDVEVATFRRDGEYSDGRHPDEVTFGSEVDDARRRDFTVNGLFFDPIDETVIDYVDGRTDLAARRLRTIGDADQRFREDHLRMLRAIRFAAELDFIIDPDTLSAIQRSADRLRSISPERIWMELARILASPARSRGWRLLLESGLRPHLAADWPDDPAADELAARRLCALPCAARPAVLGLAAAFVNVPPGPAEEGPGLDAQLGTPERGVRERWRRLEARCRSLRLSNAETDAVGWFVNSLPLVRGWDELELADLKLLLRNRHWPHLLELLRADLIAQGEESKSVDALRGRAMAVSPDSISPPPLLSGDELLADGFPSGPSLGEAIRALVRAQLNETIRTKDEAWRWVRARFERDADVRHDPSSAPPG